jgi:photosystem II stability/assembly factor-like uncharacterized protein
LTGVETKASIADGACRVIGARGAVRGAVAAGLVRCDKVEPGSGSAVDALTGVETKAGIADGACRVIGARGAVRGAVAAGLVRCDKVGPGSGSAVDTVGTVLKTKPGIT